MAKSQELAQIEEINKGLTTLNSTLNVTSENYLKLVKTISDGSKDIKDNAISFENVAKAQKQTAEEGKKLDALGKQLIASEEKLKQTEDSRLKTIIENRVATQAATQALKEKIKAEQAAEGSLVAMRGRLKELTTAYDQAGVRTKAAAKEIDSLSREIGKAEAATNRHGRGVGGYADQLGKLPGPLGAAANGASGLGKQLWALVANPIVAIIAGIVVVLTGLFKAFTSTDSGAVKFAGALKAVSNIADILMDRLWSTFKLLGSIVTFDFKGIKKNAQDAFGGIGKALGDAGKAGFTYAEVMDDIEDREAASLSRTERLRKEYVELSIASKNRALGAKEQIRLAELAVTKEEEANGIELGFMRERTEAEKNNIAIKINNNNLSVESKAKQIEEWLKLDDTQLESAKKNNAEFAKFYNENETEFQKLQKQKADEIGKESEVAEKTRRNETAIFAFKKELNDDARKEKEEATKKTEDEAEKQRKAVLDSLEKQQKLKQEITLLGIKDDDSKAQQALAFNRDDQLREAKNAEEKLLIWEKYYAELEVLTDDQNKKKYDKEKEWFKDYEDWFFDQLEKQGKKDDDEAQKKADKDKEREEEEAELIKEIKYQAAAESINLIFNLGAAKRDEEMSELERDKDKKLSNKKLTEAQKLKIEEEYDKKAAAIKTKQAKAEKLQALFNIALNTAVASMATLSKTPLPAGAVLLALTIALGALQAGFVAAQPIPKYAKGTKDAGMLGIFGESGRELMFTRSGDVALAEKPTYFEGSKFKGAKIFSNPETEKMIGMSDRHIGGYQITDERLLNELKLTRKAIESKPVAIFDKENRVIGQKTSHSQEIYLNRLLHNN